MSLKWGMNKENVIYLQNEVQSSFKIKNTSKFEAKRLEMEKSVLSDVTQAKKDTLYILTPKSWYKL